MERGRGRERGREKEGGRKREREEKFPILGMIEEISPKTLQTLKE